MHTDVDHVFRETPFSIGVRIWHRKIVQRIFRFFFAVVGPGFRLLPSGELDSVMFPWLGIVVCPIGWKRCVRALRRPASAHYFRLGKRQQLGFDVGSHG